MQQLCRQHGFHSKHLRLKQCYSVFYYYHIMSRLSFILLINGRHDINYSHKWLAIYFVHFIIKKLLKRHVLKSQDLIHVSTDVGKSNSSTQLKTERVKTEVKIRVTIELPTFLALKNRDCEGIFVLCLPHEALYIHIEVILATPCFVPASYICNPKSTKRYGS